MAAQTDLVPSSSLESSPVSARTVPPPSQTGTGMRIIGTGLRVAETRVDQAPGPLDVANFGILHYYPREE